MISLDHRAIDVGLSRTISVWIVAFPGLGPGAAAIGLPGIRKTIIATDATFTFLSPVEQRAMLLHELAHIDNRDLDLYIIANISAIVTSIAAARLLTPRMIHADLVSCAILTIWMPFARWLIASCELLADHKAAQDVGHETYTAMLQKVACHNRLSRTPGLFHPAFIKRERYVLQASAGDAKRRAGFVRLGTVCIGSLAMATLAVSIL
jgi:Zn-dependent protease with chaperone function